MFDLHMEVYDSTPSVSLDPSCSTRVLAQIQGFDKSYQLQQESDQASSSMLGVQSHPYHDYGASEMHFGISN